MTLVAVLFVSLPVAAPPPPPMRTQGRAFDRGGNPLPIGTPIRAFVDGVQYSNASVVRDAAGSYSVLTYGNSKGAGGVSDTPTFQEGANLGDTVIFAAGDFTSATDVFRGVGTWSPASVITMDLTLGSIQTTPQLVKIEGIVTQPAAGGNQFVLLCNPTGTPVSLADYYLEGDAPGNYHGKSQPLSGALGASTTVRVNLTSASWPTPMGDALKLVYRNPGGAGASAAGLDIVVDRVEFNATTGGTLNWEPGNTIMGDAPAPGIGRILERDAACTDTNQGSDFHIANQPGVPTNSIPTVSVIAPTEGQPIQGATTSAISWMMSDDAFLTAYLQVWVNVTIGNQTTQLVVNAAGVTSYPWTTPDLAVSSVVLRVDVQNPFGGHATATRTFSLTRQSPIALLVAVVIAIVLVTFLIIGFLRARKREEGPPKEMPPATPPAAPIPPAVAPPTPPPSAIPAIGKKICPQCHTAVSSSDETCFFCGYKFPGERAPPP
jgi:hypothetical protein